MGLQPLLAACGPSLTSLKLPRQCQEQPAVAQLLQLAPHLASLDFSQWNTDTDKEDAAAALCALSQLKGLTRLVPPSIPHLLELSQLPGAKGALAHVQELGVRKYSEQEVVQE